MQRNKGQRQSTIERRVQRGAQWLDRVKPEWFTQIDLGRLNLRSGCNCVLGQIVNYEHKKVRGPSWVDHAMYSSVVVRNGYGSTYDGYQEDLASIQKINVAKDRLSGIDNLQALVIPGITAKRRGFELTKAQQVDGSDEEWTALTHEWRVQIERRLAQNVS